MHYNKMMNSIIMTYFKIIAVILLTANSSYAALGGEFKTSTSQAPYEESDVFGGIGLSLFTKNTNQLNYSVSFGYEQSFDANLSDASYGFSDLVVSMQGYFKTQKALGYQFSLQVPTSKTSQEASLYSSLAVGLSGNYVLNAYLSLNSSHQVAMSIYEHKTADIQGFNFNSPFSFLNSLGLSVRESSSLYLNFGVAYSMLYLYSNEVIDLRTAFIVQTYQISKALSAQISLSWKNKIISHNSLFDHENSLLSASFITVF